MTIIETIRSSGVASHIGGKEYLTTIDMLRNKHSTLARYIGSLVVYSGSGWSINMSVSYGLSLFGIEKVIEKLGIDALVAKTHHEVIKCCARFGKTAFITDSGCMMGDLEKGHAISVFVDNTSKQITKIFINDSLGDGYHKCPLRFPYKLFVSRMERQGRDEITCNGIAIKDCLVFGQDPDMMSKMEILAEAEIEGRAEIKTLPESLCYKEMRKETIEYQIAVIKEFVD